MVEAGRLESPGWSPGSLIAVTLVHVQQKPVWWEVLDQGLPAAWGRCLQRGIAIESSGVTQQNQQPDISCRSISSTMNQSHGQPRRQLPSKTSRACAGAEPWLFSLCCSSCLAPKQDGLSSATTETCDVVSRAAEMIPEQNAAARMFHRKKCR